MSRDRYVVTSNPRFSATKPPDEWVRAHAQALRATVMARQASTPTVLRNAPVPRLASCHFFVIDNSPNNHYFY